MVKPYIYKYIHIYDTCLRNPLSYPGPSLKRVQNIYKVCKLKDKTCRSTRMQYAK